ncbi:nuclear transport factor 2 family protein [Mesorhizobium erdmanii]|uniref:nuclear transport factor 2 family protein n=1 Tax=Mesorhizobium erdmanii TaxID=1777866 RepID=UPI0003FE16DD|nr:nuclear transport factor 2 family protein [Mesorhizobium erdmanii]
MKNATQLLQDYLANIQDPAAAASLFADDGILELPTIDARAQGPEAIEKFIAGLLVRVPEFRFKNIDISINTEEQAFGEYQVEAAVPSTGKTYKQTYAGRLVAKDGKIQLLREALDTLAASQAFSKD